MLSPISSSHGSRSVSSSGKPAAIFALLSAVWTSSPSMKVAPIFSARADPIVDFPEPETPMTTMGRYDFDVTERIPSRFLHLTNGERCGS